MTKLLITIPEIKGPHPHSVWVQDPITGNLEPLSVDMLYIVDLYEYQNKFNNRYRLIKRMKFENFYWSHVKVNELTKAQEKYRKNQFLMWSKGEDAANACYRDFVNKSKKGE